MSIIIMNRYYKKSTAEEAPWSQKILMQKKKSMPVFTRVVPSKASHFEVIVTDEIVTTDNFEMEDVLSEVEGLYEHAKVSVSYLVL